MSQVAIHRQQYKEALALINRALEKSPQQPYFLNNRGYIYMMSGELELAKSDINASLSADPNNGWVYRNKGIYYYLTGTYDRAAELLNQALTMDPYIDQIHFHLGMALLKSGKKAEACKQFRMSEEAGDQMLTADLIKGCQSL